MMKLLTALIFSSFFLGTLLANPRESADTYPLKTCVVSGEDLGSMGDPLVIWHQVEDQPDREVRLCCERCEGRFNSNPEKYLAKLDAAGLGHGPAAIETAKACCTGDACKVSATNAG